MTTTEHPPAGVESSAEAGGRPHREGGEHGAHPSEAKYIVVAVVLAGITAIEVLLSYVTLGSKSVNAPLLLVGMALKFGLVAAMFMHLKFDSRILRRLFVAGLAFAVGCYVTMLLTFHSFTHQIPIHTPSPLPPR